MAETKTTVPVKVKIGAEKIARTVAKDGTDIAASNLPEFEEGSLIICKDTGNLYIDMPNESKRYSVGIGRQSINRGETFNNHYNLNCALADSTYAAGYKTQAGYNYFKVTAIDVVNKKITLGDATDLVAGLTYDILDFNVLNDKMKRAVRGTISKVEGTVVTVDNLPENTDADKLANLRFTIRINFNAVSPTNPITNQVYGNIQTNGGDQAYAIGERARAIGFDSFVGGKSNTAYGSCSSVLGKTNIAYGNNEFISGNSNIACGSNSAVFGAKNISKGHQNFTAGALNTSDGNFQTVIGLCNDNKADTLFEVGNGTYETVDNTETVTSRSNAFEVYMDGHAEIQTQGTTDKSVVIKKYLNDTIASQISSVYKAKGSIANISALAAPNKAYEGFVYNIETEFTTTANFIDGAGKVYPAGTNVVCINTTGTTYKWDVLAGMIDLSSYVTNEKLTSVLANKQDNLYLTAIKPNSSIVNITSNTNTLIVNQLRISDYSSAQGPAVVLSLGGVTSGIEFESDDSISYFGSEIVNKKSLLNFITNGFSTEREKSLLITSYNGDIYLNDKDGLGCKIRRLNAGTEDNDAVNLSQLNAKQDILVSGNNIKTINNQSILGSGNITIEGGGSGSTIVVDDDLSDTSTNPVQNKVINAALNKKQNNVGLTKDLVNSILTIDSKLVNLPSAGTITHAKYIFGDTPGACGIELATDKLTLHNSGTDRLRLLGVETPVKKASEVVAEAALPYQATNKIYVDTELANKQDKLTSTTDLVVRSISVSNVSTKLLQSGTDALQIVGSQIKLANNNNAAIKITNLADGTATSDAVNKGQLDTAVANKQDTFSTVTTTADKTTLTADKPINITTNKYSMIYDDTNEAIKITFA